LAVYFFDTSAIVKRYASEIGSAWVQSVTDPASGSIIYLARITVVEVVSAITRRLGEGSLSAPDATLATTTFRHDFVHHYRIIEMTPELTNRAVSVVQVYALRAYDAVQLATALEINEERIASGAPPIVLISADVALNAAAVAEGLAMDDPNAHP
jgi:predicted nucleic acid-binding protein